MRTVRISSDYSDPHFINNSVGVRPINDNVANAIRLDVTSKDIQKVSGTTRFATVENFEAPGFGTSPSVWYYVIPPKETYGVLMMTLNSKGPDPRRLSIELFQYDPTGPGVFFDQLTDFRNAGGTANDSENIIWLNCDGQLQGRTELSLVWPVRGGTTYYLQVTGGVDFDIHADDFDIHWVYDQWPAPEFNTTPLPRVAPECTGVLTGSSGDGIRYQDLGDNWPDYVNNKFVFVVQDSQEDYGYETRDSVYSVDNVSGAMPVWLGYVDDLVEQFVSGGGLQGSGATGSDGRQYVPVVYGGEFGLIIDVWISNPGKSTYEVWGDPSQGLGRVHQFGFRSGPQEVFSYQDHIFVLKGSNVIFPGSTTFAIDKYDLQGNRLASYPLAYGGFPLNDVFASAVNPADGHWYRFSSPLSFKMDLATGVVTSFPNPGIDGPVGFFSDGTALGESFSALRLLLPDGTTNEVTINYPARPPGAVAWGRGFYVMGVAGDNEHVYIGINTYPQQYPNLDEVTGKPSNGGRDFLNSVYWTDLSGNVEHRFDMYPKWKDTFNVADKSNDPLGDVKVTTLHDYQTSLKGTGVVVSQLGTDLLYAGSDNGSLVDFTPSSPWGLQHTQSVAPATGLAIDKNGFIYGVKNSDSSSIVRVHPDGTIDDPWVSVGDWAIISLACATGNSFINYPQVVPTITGNLYAVGQNGSNFTVFAISLGKNWMPQLGHGLGAVVQLSILDTSWDIDTRTGSRYTHITAYASEFQNNPGGSEVVYIALDPPSSTGVHFGKHSTVLSLNLGDDAFSYPTNLHPFGFIETGLQDLVDPIGVQPTGGYTNVNGLWVDSYGNLWVAMVSNSSGWMLAASNNANLFIPIKGSNQQWLPFDQGLLVSEGFNRSFLGSLIRVAGDYSSDGALVDGTTGKLVHPTTGVMSADGRTFYFVDGDGGSVLRTLTPIPATASLNTKKSAVRVRKTG